MKFHNSVSQYPEQGKRSDVYDSARGRYCEADVCGILEILEILERLKFLEFWEFLKFHRNLH